MSNASLKEQLQAVSPQLSDKLVITKPVKEVTAKKLLPPKIEKDKKSKPKWLEYVQYGVELLKVYFPACFKMGADIRPLKKGIKEDLLRRLSMLEGVVIEDKACMVKSLSHYVNTLTYHRSVVEGSFRIDLDGQAAEMVTAEEAKYSKERTQNKQILRQKTPHSLTTE